MKAEEVRRIMVVGDDHRDGPEMLRLIQHLSTSKGFSVSWGDNAFTECTAEGRAAEINRAMDAIARGDYEDILDVEEDRLPRSHQKTNVEEWVKNHD